MNTDNIKKYRKSNGIITAKEVDKYGVDSWYLTYMVRKGELERLRKYILDIRTYWEYFGGTWLWSLK